MPQRKKPAAKPQRQKPDAKPQRQKPAAKPKKPAKKAKHSPSNKDCHRPDARVVHSEESEYESDEEVTRVFAVVQDIRISILRYRTPGDRDDTIQISSPYIPVKHVVQSPLCIPVGRGKSVSVIVPEQYLTPETTHWSLSVFLDVKARGSMTLRSAAIDFRPGMPSVVLDSPEDYVTVA